MTGVARVGDQGVGVCLAHGDPRPFTTTFIGAPQGVVNVGSMGICTCNHVSIALVGSPSVFAEKLPVHRLGDTGVTPSGTYTAIMASTTVFADVGVVVPLSEAVLTDASKLFAGVQSGISYFDAIAAENDDYETPVACPKLEGTGTSDAQGCAWAKQAGVNDDPPPPPIDDDQAPPAAAPPATVVDCSSFSTDQKFDLETVLSPNFKLRQLTTGVLVKSHDVNQVSQQNGVPRAQIVCNLANLAVNVLEPLILLLREYKPSSSVRINSGFRIASNKSQHNVGQAADTSFSGFSLDDYWEFAKLCRDRLNYDQFLLEYIGRNPEPWLHFSYKKDGPNRRQVLTFTKLGANPSPGLVRVR